jgi:hypothetical membrane protein
MNLSFVLLGVTMVTACILLRRFLTATRSVSLSVGFALVGIGGVGVMMVGIFPEDSVPLIHGFGAAFPFLLGNIGVLVLGIFLALPIAVRLFTLISGTVALTALAFYATGHFLGLGVGGMERVVAYPQTIWLIILGLYLFANIANSSVDVDKRTLR